MSDEPRCSAHGYRRCTWCSLNPSSCFTDDSGCESYRVDGMHSDTCPNRVGGQRKADALKIYLPKLGEGTPVTADVTPRESVLSEAATLITGDRNKTYGSPTQNFTDTANVWNTILRRKLKDGEQITPGEVASMMIALKLVRNIAQEKRDNFVDIAGYAACGWEAIENGRPAGE